VLNKSKVVFEVGVNGEYEPKSGDIVAVERDEEFTKVLLKDEGIGFVTDATSRALITLGTEALCPHDTKAVVQAHMHPDEKLVELEDLGVTIPMLQDPKQEDKVLSLLYPSILSKVYGIKDVQEAIQALSHLAIFHHTFERPRTAMLILKMAEKMCHHLTSGDVSPLAGEEVDETEAHSLYTHVCFYMAQAYAATQRPELSAEYCQRTLERQLKMAPVDAQEWYRNCTGLMDYFLTQDRYADAELCLKACDKIIAPPYLEVPSPPAAQAEIEDIQEKVVELTADLNRRWGVLNLVILEAAAERHHRALMGERVTDDDASSSSSASLLSSIKFDGLNLGPCTMKPVSAVTTFEDAKDLFKSGHARHLAAMKYYLMDGFVTDHVTLLRNVSAMYRSLALFEPNEKRKMAMLQRRVDLLKPLLKELSKSSYADFHKQLSFEVGEVFMELAELKSGRINEKTGAHPNYIPKPTEVTKSNSFVQGGIKAFKHFTKMYVKDTKPSRCRRRWRQRKGRREKEELQGRRGAKRVLRWKIRWQQMSQRRWRKTKKQSRVKAKMVRKVRKRRLRSKVRPQRRRRRKRGTVSMCLLTTTSLECI